MTTRLQIAALAWHYPGGPPALAQELGISRRRLWSYRTRRAAVPPDVIAQLAEIALELGVELDLSSCAKRREPC